MLLQTDATGSSAPVWFYFQPTGNGTRFDAGMQHNVRIGSYCYRWKQCPAAPVFLGTKVFNCFRYCFGRKKQPLQLMMVVFIKGTASYSTSGKYVFII